MPLFNDEENKRIRYHMKMWGHLDDRFVRISGLMPQFTPKQISHHWKNHLDPQLYCPKNRPNFWNLKRKSPGKYRIEEEPGTVQKYIVPMGNFLFTSGQTYYTVSIADSYPCHSTNRDLMIHNYSGQTNSSE
ncbi:hypothetical protein RhiirA5_371442 [Rhizophagus irregularis]|uniref:HTH myb-type domain-containing protein n=3 Tax=Rhizophagus irregularis TaxID=588596 RepID=A0A2N0Q5U4_9GLOM|nr:hypothetical protein GLOIN_2v1886514 [Rhizophagus irregularis DAOM 181602=DAOM 197198]EXX64989.1 hypothetical protein RirG_137590 [Rhizophagus irregularis DAOM 197198w]PKC14450.1 hypothetical protein RhiirA5_371442 [Rhizophagus irregularis]POG56631.1 hypothetical protein GLOIN_2v1886514 [Rhizophagus irregularis DAOM 181602=DAOM 197198]UZO11929.1 hypothetical protein OCT59_003482 [Rhizophagus irregularis]CAB4485738.1 unnamed protein product [Rhizophagus irregularis]|eukprot:XP_025164355.1 hypothetical protein GLOIN_2v1886514 [Rhizophagus irregularis DAOM 181602=DAOM 197198]